MAEQSSELTQESYPQLTQQRVPLEDAATAFSNRDAAGNVPIVLLPENPFRLRLELIAVGLVAVIVGAVFGALMSQILIMWLLVGVGVLVIVMAVYRSYYLRIPEGANALLSRGGRYTRTLESGPHFIPPWFAITHLVTRRQIPFFVPIIDAPTKENVRANVETLITFTISDPFRFVYSISADDFDQVLQAACQDRLRSMVRGVTTEAVNDLAQADLSELRESLNKELELYGITISKINVLVAQPPAEFMQSQEARQLAVVQQAEQAEKQALALRRQQDEAALARQEVIARVEREREQLQLAVQQAETRRRVFELEAEAEALRMAKLQERLQEFPAAMDWEWQGEQLGVVKALAGNSRVVIQVGEADALVRGMVLRDLPHADNSAATDALTALEG